MTRTLRGSLLIASVVVVLWTTSSQACHWRSACQPAPCGQGPYYGAGGGYGMAGGGYYNGGYAGGTAVYAAGTAGYAAGTAGYPAGAAGYPAGAAGYPGAYGYGQPYNPGGIGGPASGLGVRPGLGVGGMGRGR
jgi:hypothetical protein